MQLRMRWLGQGGLTLAALVGLLSVPALPRTGDAQTAAAGTEGTPTTVVVSGGGNRSLFKIALPKPLGDPDSASSVVETESRDLTLSSLFQVLDPTSFTANLTAEGAGIDPTSWRNVGAEGVVKGSVFPRGAATAFAKVFCFFSSVSVPEPIESYESLVIQGERPDSQEVADVDAGKPSTI